RNLSERSLLIGSGFSFFRGCEVVQVVRSSFYLSLCQQSPRHWHPSSLGVSLRPFHLLHCCLLRRGRQHAFRSLSLATSVGPWSLWLCLRSPSTWGHPLGTLEL